jgi:D-aminopeptidase
MLLALALMASSPIPAESRQLLLSLAAGWEAATSRVQLFQREAPEAPWTAVGPVAEASLGRTGLGWGRGLHRSVPAGPRKREGDGRSPAGVYALRFASGYSPEPPPGIRLAYLPATPTLACVDDPSSAHYNRLVDEAAIEKEWSSSERMLRSDDLYRLLVWIGHNDEPVEPGAGSCIFLHLRSTPAAATAGCTALDAGALERVLAWLDPAAAPVLVQLPEGLHASLAGAWRLPPLEERPRARDLGLAPGVFPPGPLNAISDVAGVRVGHLTLVAGDRVRTGVTAVLPHAGNVFAEKVPGAVFVGNAFGKLAGSTQVRELGTIETPIVLTNTLAVGPALEAVVAWTLEQPGNEGVRSVNALVGETNDGVLNDIRGRHVRGEHVRWAIAAAREGPVPEGTVGAGTGSVAFGWKGGIGGASRVLPPEHGGHALGVLVQSNFGGVLSMDGVPVGRELGRHLFAGARDGLSLGEAAGSCMIVVATDAPLDSRALERLAARALFGLARTGAAYAHGSGDYAIAFSTHLAVRVRHADLAPGARPVVPDAALSPLFQAALEATEEAVLNSLLQATGVSGSGRRVEALPLGRLRELLLRYGRGSAAAR